MQKEFEMSATGSVSDPDPCGSVLKNGFPGFGSVWAMQIPDLSESFGQLAMLCSSSVFLAVSMRISCLRSCSSWLLLIQRAVKYRKVSIKKAKDLHSSLAEPYPASCLTNKDLMRILIPF